jgi:phosphoserine phosphatase
MILDLDGTILSINSFRVWSMFMVRGRFPHLGAGHRARVAAAAVGVLIQRKMGLTNHTELKCQMQTLWKTAIAGDDGACERRLIAELRAYVRPELVTTLAGIAQGKIDGVLATAAAGDYAYALGRALGFQHVLATSPTRHATDPDNSGESKLNAVLSFLRAQSWQDRPRVLFTDHRDDLPLIRACPTVYWFGDPEEGERIAQSVPGASLHRGFNPQYLTAMSL